MFQVQVCGISGAEGPLRFQSQPPSPERAGLQRGLENHHSTG